MELQFENTGLGCLRGVTAAVRSEEQTQELRLPEHLPDVGRVLGAWGQVLLRGKEWRSGGMGVHLGVLAHVLYMGEDGSGIQSLESWIPFNLKWEFPQTRHDGTILASCLLSGVDARCLSARKLMVRASVSVLGEALEPDRMDLFQIPELPGDVQVLKRSYPVELNREAGEKSFSLEEELVLPGSAGEVERILCCSVRPEVLDRKILAGKAVFRGMAVVRILFLDPEGELRTWEQDVSFSQFADLEGSYGEDAQVRIVPAVTALEVEVMEPRRLGLKAELVGQYVVSDRTVVDVVEDAYSPVRSVTPKLQELVLPGILDRRTQTVDLNARMDWEGDRVLAVETLLNQPRIRREGNALLMEIPGSFQVLYRDQQGELCTGTVHAEGSMTLPADPDSHVVAAAVPGAVAQAVPAGQSMNLSGDVLLWTQTGGGPGIPMITGLELGEITGADPHRPSMVLCRAGNRRLWDLAKAWGSSVDAILRANDLRDEPEADRLLLIPVN